MSKTILGGGIGGLTAAYYLSKKFPLQYITLLEGSSRTGGWIKSTRSDLGFIFEQGPRTMRPFGEQGLNTLQLIEELNLESEIQSVASLHPAAARRLIYMDGNLQPLPFSIRSIFKPQSPFSKSLLGYLLNDIKTPPKILATNDDSVYNFINRRFGKDIADYVISPLICGICAGDAKSISVKLLYEKLFQYEQIHGGIFKGMLYSMLHKKKIANTETHLAQKAKAQKWGMYYFMDGFEVLPQHLEQVNKQNGVHVELNTKCYKLSIGDKVTVEMLNNDPITSDHLISCISAKDLGNILQGHEPLKELLQSIPFVTVCTINLYYDRKVLKEEAFGFLVPPKENLPILGVIYDSCLCSNNDNTVLTVMMGGSWFEKHFGDDPSEEHLLNIAIKQLESILNINIKPHTCKVNILKDCIAQYTVGHNKRRDEINNYIKDNKLPVSLCGASFNGIGINDVIYNSKVAVDAIEI